MKRVVVLGCSGAGKSTFARELAQRIGATVVHLDALFWQPGWVEPVNDEFRAKVAAAVAGDAWVTDGNYVGRTYDLRLPRADAVIFLDESRWLCLMRVIRRWLFAFGRTRPDMAEGCFENMTWDFFLWVWNFEKRSKPRILALAGKYPTPVTVLRGKKAIARFLSEIPRATST